MAAQGEFGAMRENGLADWETLAVGWNRGWISKREVADWVEHWLGGHLEEGRTPVLLLASADTLEDEAVTSLLSEVGGGDGAAAAVAVEKWRLMRLMDLASSELSWEEKVTQLECLRAEFGYPEDMVECTRYGSTNVDAIEALNAVIAKLKVCWGVR